MIVPGGLPEASANQGAATHSNSGGTRSLVMSLARDRLQAEALAAPTRSNGAEDSAAVSPIILYFGVSVTSFFQSRGRFGPQNGSFLVVPRVRHAIRAFV
jgi:hypothetical protein